MTDVQWSAGISLFYGNSFYDSTPWRGLMSETDVYGWGSVGYMLTQLPGSLLLSKYKPRIILPLTMYVTQRARVREAVETQH
jgi:hypothetical protein